MLLESHNQALLTNKTVTGIPGGYLNLWVDFHSAVSKASMLPDPFCSLVGKWG